MSLQIASYNCFSIRKRVEQIRNMLSEVDILMCQETILTEENCNILNMFNADFNYVAVPSLYATSETGEGRPSGGLVVFYHKKLRVSRIAESKHFQAVRVDFCNFHFALLNIYMPSDHRDQESLSDFECVLGELQDILDNLDEHRVILMGDMNADPIRRSRFWPSTEEFLKHNDLNMNDLSLPLDTFTYLSAAHNSTSWIDHVMSSRNMEISQIRVRYEWSLFDHFPITAKLELPPDTLFRPLSSISSEKTVTYVDWDKLESCENYERYNNLIIEQMTDAQICTENACSEDHRTVIDCYYSKLLDALRYAASHFKKHRRLKRFKPVPGWNEFCKRKYDDARQAFLAWKGNGKTRYGAIYDSMIETRKTFRKALKFCRYREQQIRDTHMAADYANRNSKNFWRKVKARRGQSTLVSEEIDGVHGPGAIAEVFARKFSLVNGTPPSTVPNLSCPNAHEANASGVKITTDQIMVAIKQLKDGRGFDDIEAKHLKYMNNLTVIYLNRLYNACLCHSYLPQPMLEGVMQPRIKNKFGDVKSSDNYREVMISSNLLKLFEYIVLPIFKDYCSLSPCQFGYREKTATTDAVTIIKEIAKKYNDEGSTVYACFLDMSKAFERVNPVLLLQKLTDYNVPPNLLGTLKYALHNSQASVEFNGVRSRKWLLRKGLRQGGVLSSYLFCIYVDSMLEKISSEDYGCRLGVVKRNILAYADDVTIFCPTAAGLHELLEIFAIQCEQHGLLLNYDKTKALKFGRQDESIFTVQGSVIETVPEFKYLGVMLSCDLRNSKDIKRAHSAFNRNLGVLLRQFHSVDFEIKLKLFDSFCKPLYGLDIWFDRKYVKTLLKQLGVSYHLGLKKLSGYPRYFSNHYVCEQLNCSTFEHFLNLRNLKAFRRLSEASSKCMVMFQTYLSKLSYCRFSIDELFRDCYQIDDIFNNDFDAIVSRIGYVQAHEHSSWFFGL